MLRPAFAATFAAALLLSGSAFAFGSFSDTPKASLSDAKELVDRGAYREAIPKLQAIVTADPRNADALNLLGFSYRKLKDYPNAKRNYDAALAVNPDHRGALEYLGEYYVETGDLPAARALLARLRSVCPAGCEEQEDLEQAIDKAGGRS